MAERFRQYYIDRIANGKVPDINVTRAIADPRSSTVKEALDVILRNPFNVIQDKGFFTLEKQGNDDVFVLAPALKVEINEQEINKILSIVEQKLSYYYSNIDKGSQGKLREVIEKFVNGYVDAKKSAFTGSPFGTFVRADIPNAIYDTKLVDPHNYLITGSVGQGNWATIPWICIFDRSITTTATKGVYIVYLLSKTGESLYLTFNQGCTDIRNAHSKQDTIKIMREKAADIAKKIDNRGFSTDENINLGQGLTELGELYQKGTIVYKEYKKGAIPSEQELQDDLFKMMDIYRDYVETVKGHSEEKNNKWLPKLEDYNPGIDVDKWYELLNDRSVFDEKSLLAMACMMDNGGQGSCTELGKKYHQSMTLWRTTCGVHLASRVAAATHCPVIQEDDKTTYFCIPFLYRKTTNDEQGSYIYKFRPELEKALKRYGIERYLKISEGKKQLSVKEEIDYIKNYISAKGFSYNDGLIEDFYLSLKSKPFVILAGTSGTGKTRLVKLFAGAVGAFAKESGGNGRFKLVSVRPDWSDSTDLFGHTDLNGNYIPGAIIDFVKEAKENLEYPYFLCLDEMNLSRVEYYLSDFLSLIETRTNVNGEIKTYKLTLDKAAEKDYPDLYIPENLYVIGTVNMDETTFPFSKKVLDRANTIEFSYVDLSPSFSSSAEAVAPLDKDNDFFKSEYLVLGTDVKPEQQELAMRVSADLQNINKVLQQANAHVGYRVRDEIVFYMLNNDTAKLLDYDTAFDYEIMQKILPRIQGSSEGIKNMMCELFKMFAGDYSGFSQSYIWKQMDDCINNKSCKYKNSAQKLCYMMRRFEEDGFTSYWL